MAIITQFTVADIALGQLFTIDTRPQQTYKVISHTPEHAIPYQCYHVQSSTNFHYKFGDYKIIPVIKTTYFNKSKL